MIWSQLHEMTSQPMERTIPSRTKGSHLGSRGAGEGPR